MTSQPRWGTIDTPFGTFTAWLDDVGRLTQLDLHGRGADGSAHARRDERAVAEVRRQVEAYCAGDLRVFALELAPRGTAFQRAVWQALLEIPYGLTLSYRELAARIGRPTAVRAVGAANGANPIGLIVPCHRVIGADGSLTGYGGGLPLKRALLLHEARHAPLLRAERTLAGL
jgi:methylated-DNA-[protein]-cysteine S-methyltransferase